MNFNDVHRGVHKNKARKRLGRGIGSGQGKTAGRGHNAPRAAEASPLPSEETTPPVMKMYRAMDLQNTANGLDSKREFFNHPRPFAAGPATKLQLPQHTTAKGAPMAHT